MHIYSFILQVYFIHTNKIYFMSMLMSEPEIRNIQGKPQFSPLFC